MQYSPNIPRNTEVEANLVARPLFTPVEVKAANV
jgi:hypothetical protein